MTKNQKYLIQSFKSLGKDFNGKVIAVLPEGDFFLPGRFSLAVQNMARKEKTSVEDLNTDDMVMKFIGQDPKSKFINLEFL